MKKKSNYDIYEDLHSTKMRRVLYSFPELLADECAVVIAGIIVILACLIYELPYPHSHGETIFEHITGWY